MKYNEDGSLFVIEVTEDELPHGLYSPSGALRVTQDPGEGLYAPNGSIRVDDDGEGAYSPSGAWNGTLLGSSFTRRGQE